MGNSKAAKARIQYSSRDELDMAVIAYCRGRSRHDLHHRTRLALNGFYGPFAIASTTASADDIQRQALRSIRQLTHQIWEIKAQFLLDGLGLNALEEGRLDEELVALDLPEVLTKRGGRGGAAHGQSVASARTEAEPRTISPARNRTDSAPMDAPLREFLGEDAAIMAGLNPFVNDLT